MNPYTKLSYILYTFIGFYGHTLQKISDAAVKFVWPLGSCRVPAIGLAPPQDSDGAMAPVAMDVEGGSSMGGMRDAPSHTHTHKLAKLTHISSFLPSFRPSVRPPVRPSVLPSFLPSFLPFFFPSFLSSSLSPFLACLLACLFACLLACFDSC